MVSSAPSSSSSSPLSSSSCVFSVLGMAISAEAISLGLVAIIHTYLLFQCSPYIGYMTVTLLLPGPYPDDSYITTTNTTSTGRVVTVDNIGWYAGWLGTAFTAGRCLSFVPWKLFRHYKPKAALMTSLFLSTICSIWFGLSTTFLSAISSRFCLGLSNTLSACIKRIAIDHAKKTAIESAKRHKHEQQTQREQLRRQQEREQITEGDDDDDDDDDDDVDYSEHARQHEDDLVQKHEELAPSKVLSIMWWGSAIGPVVGGLLSNPGTFHRETLLPDRIEHQYPYFLPNLIGAFFCVVSLIGVYFFVDPDAPRAAARKTDVDDQNPSNENTPLLLQPRVEDRNWIFDSDDDTSPATSIHQHLSRWGSLWKIQVGDDLKALRVIWKIRDARDHLIAYWTFSFVVVCIDEGLALWLIARLSGPGLSPLVIGWMYSLGAVQAIIRHPWEVDRIVSQKDERGIGLYPSLRMASILANVPVVFTTLMMVINGGTYYDFIETTTADSMEKLSANAIDESQDDPGNMGEPGYISFWSFIFMVILIGFRGIFSSIYFACIGVASGRTVTNAYRDPNASIATFGALCARAVAPVIAGWIVAMFMRTKDGHDAVFLWCVFGLVFGLGASFFTFRLSEPGTMYNSSGENEERRHRRQIYLNARQRALAYVKLWEVHWDEGSDTPGSKWRRLARKAIAANRMKVSSKTSDDTTPVVEPTKKLKRRHGSWSNHFLTPGMDVENVPFFILGLKKGDTSYYPNVLTPALMGALQNELPLAHTCDNFFLKFSMVRDGTSFDSLEARILMIPNTIIAIETLDGDVFGCFMKNYWKRTNRFEMSGESFLWRMKQRRIVSGPSEETDPESPQNTQLLEETIQREEDIEVYRWTGETDDCQLFGDKRLAAGGGMVNSTGGFGFILNDDLSSGTSGPCLAYDNPCLVSNPEGRFEVANLEVWTMTPHLLQPDAERAEESIRFIHQNLVSPTGDKPSAAASKWTNFL